MTKFYVCVSLVLTILISAMWSDATEEAAQTVWTPSERTDAEIDHPYFKDRLLEEVMHRVDASPTSNGYFKTSLNRRWKPAGEQKSHLVSQTRLLYVMAQGYDLTGRSTYLKALRNGADFLLLHYRAPQKGKWYWRVSANSKVIDKSKSSYNAYGQAFVIFGLSHAYRLTDDQRYLNAALATWENLEVWDVVGTSRTPFEGYSQNALMHTFEALLALHEATGIDALLDDAQRLADFVLDRLYQEKDAYIPEKFESKWRPLPPDKGGYVDIGHQFEWAFLLSWGGTKGAAQRLYYDWRKTRGRRPGQRLRRRARRYFC